MLTRTIHLWGYHCNASCDILLEFCPFINAIYLCALCLGWYRKISFQTVLIKIRMQQTHCRTIERNTFMDVLQMPSSW